MVQVAELARRVQAGQADNTPGRRALYSNLGHDEILALQIDETVKRVRPDGWRGIDTREKVIKRAMYAILQDQPEVERIFSIYRVQWFGHLLPT